MKLKSLNKFVGFLILIFLFQPLNAEEEIDIWNKEAKEKSEIKKVDNSNKIISNSINAPKINNKNNLNKILTIELPIADCRLYLSCIVKKYI